MANVAAFLSMSSASCFTGQPSWSSPFVRLKVTPLPPRRLQTSVIRCHLEDWSPKELQQFRKKEAQKKLRKIRKERRSKRRAEELAQIPKVKPNPAMLRFERPLVDWNKPWRKRKVSVAKNHNGQPLGLGSKQVEPKSLWRQFDAIFEEKMKKAADGSVGSGGRFQKSSTETIAAVQHLKTGRGSTTRSVGSDGPDETLQASKIGIWRWSRSAPSVDGKHSVPTSLRRQDTVASKCGDNRDTQGSESFHRDLSRNKLDSSTESMELIREERMAVKVSASEVPRIAIGRRKGEDVYLSIADDDATVTKEIPRSDLDEDKQLEWLAKQLDSVARPDGVHLSRLMRSGGLKITDGRSLILLQKLGELGNWRCALQVFEWLNSRNQFPLIRSRYLCTTLLAVLGKAKRPVESLSIFNAMRNDVATYPDMPAYRIIAVTLGRAGQLEELLELMQSLRKGPNKSGKYLLMVNQGYLLPDIVVYNAALNACVSHRHWRVALWILDQIYKEKDVQPNSASYGLAIEVMVKAGKFDLAWKILAKMELGGFHLNSLTYKALVEGLGKIGKADLAIQMVKQMEERGIVAVPGVYYALACTLCTCGKWQDALLQVDRIGSLSGRPLVDTYTGFIKACKESGRWRDAISVFEHMREVCAPNIGTYNIMISVYGANNMYDEAKDLFDQIKKGRTCPPQLYRDDRRLSPDVFTYDAMLGACTNSGKWEDLEVLFRQMLLQGYQLNSKRHTWIVQAIAAAGKDDLVAAMFSHLKSLNAETSELYVVMIKSFLAGGEQNKAFSYLEEMVTRNMRISSSDLQIFQGMASLLSEEDSSIFLNKVESLNSSCDFNFKEDYSVSSSRQKSFALKQLTGRHSLSNKRHSNTEGMRSKELLDDSLENISTSRAIRSLQEKSFHSALSPVELITNDWPSEEPEEDRGKLQSRLDDSQSTLISGHIPGWECLWKRSTHTELSSSKLHLLELLA